MVKKFCQKYLQDNVDLLVASERLSQKLMKEKADLKKTGHTRSADFKKAGHNRYTSRSALDKVYFQHHLAYGRSKYFQKSTCTNNVLRDNTFKITIDQSLDIKQDYLQWLTSLFTQKRKEAGH